MYSTEAISKDTIVCDYDGKFTPEKDYTDNSKYSLKYRDENGEGWIIDSKDSKNAKGRYINYSKLHWNLKPLRVLLPRFDNKNIVLFRAMREIGAGEQLTWNYGDDDEIIDKEMKDCVSHCVQCSRSSHRERTSAQTE